MNKIKIKYWHIEIEKNKYNFWKKNNFFKCDINSKQTPFSIVIPPPNITGKLHLGHALDTILQDAIIRYKKLNGFDVLYLPGMDHAGIATQIKVEEQLKNENTTRQKLGKKLFIKKILKFKKNNENMIYNQWQKLGLSLDYSKEQFTLNNNFSNAVQKVFVELYNQKLIYRGKKIVSWDYQLQTALSDIEVSYREIKGEIYYIKYFLENNKNEYITIATTRPETMFADQCLVINSDNKFYSKYLNKKVINPANNTIIPIIFDNYVKNNFGLEVIKCSPAHDYSDFEIGIKNNLQTPICINPDGKMNKLANQYQNQDHFIARKNLINDLKNNGFIEKIEEKTYQISFSDKSNSIIEPYLSKQWFVKMKPLVKEIIKKQNSKSKIIFFPKYFNKILLNWSTNIQDWCISRQLWWGHQLPVWYNKNNKNNIYVNIKPPKNINQWTKDLDVLDTWFSSSLWAFTSLGWNWNNLLFQKYYPIDVLVTGYDIIFFWVLKMICQSLKFTKQIPFKTIIIHGIIRDQHGKKMSKSLNNGIDPIDIIEKYGADTLRYFLLSNNNEGKDLTYSEEKIKLSWNFVNKIWNISRYLLLNLSNNFKPVKNFNLYIKTIKKNIKENEINYWIINELTKNINMINFNMKKYNFFLINKNLYDFIINKYCSWYIELTKINLIRKNTKIKNFTLQTIFFILKQIVIILHPFIPFITEEIYQSLKLKKSIMLESFPFSLNYKFKIFFLNDIINIVNVIRKFRQEQNIDKIIKLKLKLIINNQKMFEFFKNKMIIINKYIIKIVNVIIVDIILSKYFLFNKNKIIIPLELYNIEIINNLFTQKTENNIYYIKKIKYLKTEITRSKNILNNKLFIQKAKPEKIYQEKEKYHRYIEQYEQLLTKLKNK